MPTCGAAGLLDYEHGYLRLQRVLNAMHPVSFVALLVTLVLLFGFQDEQIINQPLIIALLAVPILIQMFFNSGPAYLLNRVVRSPLSALRSPHCALRTASQSPLVRSARGGCAARTMLSRGSAYAAGALMPCLVSFLDLVRVGFGERGGLAQAGDLARAGAGRVKRSVAEPSVAGDKRPGVGAVGFGIPPVG